jgi:hypothetical protein
MYIVHVPLKLKGEFYHTAVRLAILYGTYCWAVKNQQENKISVVDIRMLCWMCGKTRLHRIRNDNTRVRERESRGSFYHRIDGGNSV